jgi:hypothetical protein
MKKILLLLLISFSAVAQDEVIDTQNFSVNDDKIIIWTKIYEIDSINVLESFKQKLNIHFLNQNSGYVDNLKLRCKEMISIYAEGNFKVNFRIDFKEDKYRIIVSNIVFENTMQYNYGSISTSKNYSNIEDYELRTRDNLLRKNEQSISNRICLNELFESLFSVKNIKIDDKW